MLDQTTTPAARLAWLCEELAAGNQFSPDLLRQWAAEARTTTAPARKARVTAKPAFADYPVECSTKKIMWPSPVIEVTYADGERVRMSFASIAGKPLNIGRGLRVAAAAWQSRAQSKGEQADFSAWLERNPEGRAAIDAAHDASVAAYEARDAAGAALAKHEETGSPDYPNRGDFSEPGDHEAAYAAYLAWHSTSRDLKHAAEEAAAEYKNANARAAIVAGEYKRKALAELVPQTVPAVVACHVEAEGETIATVAPELCLCS